MNILMVGNFSQPHCSEVHWAATLEDLGHQVTRVQENAIRSNTLPSMVIGNDLFMWVRTWEGFVTHKDLTQIRALGVPSINYHLDFFIGLDRGRSINTDPRWRCDFVVTPDGSPKSQEVFKHHGVNHFYIKPGVYKPDCYISPVKNHGDGNDVLFIGGGDRVGSPKGYGHKKEWPYRDQLVTWLYDTYGDRFTKLGYPQRTSRNDDLNRVLASSRVVIGDSLSLNFTHDHYWSDRVYETLGRGGFIIHPHIVGMEEEFTDGENIVFYKFSDFKELKDKIDYYISHDAEREKIRDAGNEFVKNNCTYHVRMQTMLDILRQEGAIK